MSDLVTDQELQENGITVSGDAPQRVPIVPYPEFDESCDSLLKKHLTREVWSNLKKKTTKKKGNIQLCVKSGVLRPEGKIGIFATDDEAYKVFSDIFGPIIKDLHPKFDYRYSYKYDALADLDKQIAAIEEELQKVPKFKLSVRRNFSSAPFAPLMNKECKFKIERKVVEVLGELYGKYTQFAQLDEKDTEWLLEQGINVEKNPEHDAGGINDDWPMGRGVFIHEQKEYVILVN